VKAKVAGQMTLQFSVPAFLNPKRAYATRSTAGFSNINQTTLAAHERRLPIGAVYRTAPTSHPIAVENG